MTRRDAERHLAFWAALLVPEWNVEILGPGDLGPVAVGGEGAPVETRIVAIS